MNDPTPTTLRRRLAALEVSAAILRAGPQAEQRAQADRDRQSAWARVLDVLKARYPRELVRPPDGGIPFEEQIAAASARLRAGAATDADREALRALPVEALQTLERSAEDAVHAFATVLNSC